MVTSKGLVIRIATHDVRIARNSGITGITLKHGDSLVTASLTHGDNEVMLLTRNGYGLRDSEAQIRATGRNAQGVRGISAPR